MVLLQSSISTPVKRGWSQDYLLRLSQGPWCLTWHKGTQWSHLPSPPWLLLLFCDSLVSELGMNPGLLTPSLNFFLSHDGLKYCFCFLACRSYVHLLWPVIKLPLNILTLYSSSFYINCDDLFASFIDLLFVAVLLHLCCASFWFLHIQAFIVVG